MVIRPNVWYVDPSWTYNSARTGGNLKPWAEAKARGDRSAAAKLHTGLSGSAQKYPVMSLDAIMALPIAECARRDAVCFLWVTVPLIREGLRTLARWGFEYKTLIEWRKVGINGRPGRLGMGHWFRGNVELCLLGVRGNVAPFKCSRRNHIDAPIGEHSAKPIEMRRLIELATAGMPQRKMVELFAREHHAGWLAYGHGVGTGDIGRSLGTLRNSVGPTESARRRVGPRGHVVVSTRRNRGR